MSPKTLNEVKDEFAAQGLTFASWAASHGFEAQEVYRVINGIHKGRRGRAHEIAVKLGLKNPNPLPRGPGAA